MYFSFQGLDLADSQAHEDQKARRHCPQTLSLVLNGRCPEVICWAEIWLSFHGSCGVL